MQDLNYHHLFYFWVVAREGSIARACEQLAVAQPTISSQLRDLEASLGAKLLTRAGRGLVLTDTGKLVFDHAERIFRLGQDLLNALNTQTPGRPLRLVVGAADVLPKLILYRLLRPLKEYADGVRIVCREGKPGRLLADLASHNLDLVLSDLPASPLVKIQAFSHLLGECGVTIFGTTELARRYGKDFPRGLAGAPMLLPTEDTASRRLLEHWLRTQRLSIDVRGEFDDSALMKCYGEAGEGIFAMPTVIEDDVCRHNGVKVIGRVENLRVRLYAITTGRKVEHPAVQLLMEKARTEMFG